MSERTRRFRCARLKGLYQLYACQAVQLGRQEHRRVGKCVATLLFELSEFSDTACSARSWTVFLQHRRNSENGSLSFEVQEFCCFQSNPLAPPASTGVS